MITDRKEVKKLLKEEWDCSNARYPKDTNKQLAEYIKWVAMRVIDGTIAYEWLESEMCDIVHDTMCDNCDENGGHGPIPWGDLD